VAPINHVFTSPQADVADPTLIKPSAWNSAHAYTLQDAVSLAGNTAGALANISSGTLILAGGNNVTLSQNGNSVTVSGAASAAQTEQTQSRFNLTLGGNTSGALALISSGVMTLAGGNNITLSQAGNVVTISGAVTVAQTVQTQNIVNVTLSGNTAGVLAHISSGTMTLAGGANITLSQAGNAVTVIGEPAGTGGGGAPIATTVQSVASANSVGTVTRYAAEDHRHGGLYQISVGGNTAGNTSAGAGSLMLAGGPNITLSGATAAGGMTLSVSAGAGGAATFNTPRFVEVNGPLGGLTAAVSFRQTNASNRLMLQPFVVLGTMSVNTVNLFAVRSAAVSLVMTANLGFYTAVNATSLALISSTANAFSQTNSNSFSGTRVYQLTGLSNLTLSQGRYWMGLNWAATGTAVVDMVLLGGTTTPTPIGFVLAGTDSTAATANSALYVPFSGVYSATTNGAPANIGASDMFGGAGSNHNFAYYAAIREA
jgi:hypothetical protein